jgi:hypothetical protein
MASQKAVVVRSGEEREIDATELVPATSFFFPRARK